MNTDLYIDVQFEAEGIDLELHARVVSTVHGVMANYGRVAMTELGVAELALAWPDFDGQHFGQRVRVFGAYVWLADLTKRLFPLIEAGLIRVPTPKETPASDAWQVFLRDYATEKALPGRVRYINAYRARHGIAARRRAPAEPVAEHKAAHLKLSSHRGGQQFSLFIRAEPTQPDAAVRGGIGYGLGHPVPVF